jgi:CRP-like cAMP-binding protein
VPVDSFLENLPFMSKLPLAARVQAARSFVLQKYPKGTAVFEEGDPPEAVHLVRSGLVKVMKYSPGVEPVTMEIIVPGGLFGMAAVLDKKPYPVSTRTLSKAEIYSIPAPVFDGMLKSFPGFAQEVFTDMGNHVRHMQTLRSMAMKPVENRIAYIVYLLQSLIGKDIAVRREDIAEMASVTVGTAIRTLADFRKKKWIASGWSRITVLNAPALQSLAESE